jgi:DNA-binding transcriptional regulator PaaX
MGLLAENLSYSQRITHLLKTIGKTTAIEMIEELGIEKDALWPALSRMKQRGQVVKLGDYYALAVQ